LSQSICSPSRRRAADVRLYIKDKRPLQQQTAVGNQAARLGASVEVRNRNGAAPDYRAVHRCFFKTRAAASVRAQ